MPETQKFPVAKQNEKLSTQLPDFLQKRRLISTCFFSGETMCFEEHLDIFSRFNVSWCIYRKIESTTRLKISLSYIKRVTPERI